MALNLISDPWIPVVRADGTRCVIAPWEIADPSLLRPDWPRADLNIACLELLIGLVFLADPPAHSEEWDERQAPQPPPDSRGDRRQAGLGAVHRRPLARPPRHRQARSPGAAQAAERISA